MAKIASDVGKPDGLCVVAPDQLEAFLHPLPVKRLWGVGAVTGETLARLGIRTIGDVARAGERTLEKAIGVEHARHLQALARGDDPREVIPHHDPVSLGSENTFEQDLKDRERLGEMLLGQADEACARLRSQGLRARTVMIKVKYGNHDLVTRRKTLPHPTSDARVVGDVARELLVNVPAIEQRGVRLTGVSLTGLVAKDAPRQLSFDEPKNEKGERLAETLDKISAKFGGDRVVKRAIHLRRDDD